MDRDPGEKAPIQGWSSKRFDWSIGDPSFRFKSGRSTMSASSVVLKVRYYAYESLRDQVVTFLNAVMKQEAAAKCLKYQT